MPLRLSRPTDVAEDHQQLIDMLWRFYMAANDPSMRKIAGVIAGMDDDQRNGTANPETIRRTLSAHTLPQWQTVEVIFLALCELADVDPDDDNDDRSSRWHNAPRTHRAQLHQHYRLAKYGTLTEPPRTRGEKARQRALATREDPPDPWASVSKATDEPPF